MKNVLILYGSQNGTAAYLAKITKEAIKYGFDELTIVANKKKNLETKVLTLEMDMFNLEHILNVDHLIYLCSTHGDGCEPFNMRNFLTFLMFKDLPNNFLKKLSFSVFGLGDSSYEKFNYCAKRLNKRMFELGASAFVESRYGDHQDKCGLNSQFKPWLADICDYIARMPQINSKIDCSSIANKKQLYSGWLRNKQVLTPADYDKEILLLEFDIPDYKEYLPGDCLAILPFTYNSQEFFDYVFEHNKSQKKEEKTPTTIYKDEKTIIAKQILVEQTELHFTVEQRQDFIETLKQFDINCIPAQQIFYNLWNYVKNTNYVAPTFLTKEKVLSRLFEIFTDFDLYYDYVLKPKRTFFEVVKELNIKPGSKFIKNYLPLVTSRYFTTAKYNGLYQVYLSVVKYKSARGNLQNGLCSHYLNNLEIGTNLKISIGKSNLYTEASKYLFLVTGTGVTLPWSFVNFHKDKIINIYYGFRYHTKDKILEKKIIDKALERNNKINLKLVASREEEKFHVQIMFKKDKIEDIDEYLIFVCGNQGINKELKQILYEKYGRKIVFQSETW